MKKLLASLLIGAICVTASGCGAQSGEEGGYEPGGEISGEITVSCFDSMISKSFLESAAAAFTEKYPGTEVNVDAYASMPEIKTSETGDGMSIAMVSIGDNEQEKNDYIQKINTELMSGGGADVLAIDVLPYYKYADIGQLEDLNDYMNKDDSFNAGDYRENILNAVKYKGGQYILPLGYSFNYLAYDSSLFEAADEKLISETSAYTYENLIELGGNVHQKVNASSEDTVYMFGMPPIQMLSRLMEANYRDYIDVESKKANLGDGSFAALLESVKEYEAKGYIKDTEQSGNALVSSTISEGGILSGAFEQYLYKAKMSGSLLQEFNSNSGYLTVSGGYGSQENDKIAGMIKGENDDITFSYSQAYGINSNSDNKTLAWEFIKFLLSAEVQTSMSLMDIPVNIEAAYEKAKMQLLGNFSGMAATAAVAVGRNTQFEGTFGEEESRQSKSVETDIEEGGETEEALTQTENKELTDEQKEALQKYTEELDRLTKMINAYHIKDTIIEGIVNTELELFFNGSKTAEETASVLQNKINLYLNE